MNKWKILVLALSSGERYKNVKNTILRKRSGGAVPQPPVLTFQMDVDRIFSSGYFYGFSLVGQLRRGTL